MAREGPYKKRLTLDMTRNFPEPWPPVTEGVAPLPAPEGYARGGWCGCRPWGSARPLGPSRRRAGSHAQVGQAWGGGRPGARAGGDSSGGGGGEAAQGPTRMTPEQAAAGRRGPEVGRGRTPSPEASQSACASPKPWPAGPRAPKPPPRGPPASPGSAGGTVPEVQGRG